MVSVNPGVQWRRPPASTPGEAGLKPRSDFSPTRGADRGRAWIAGVQQADGARLIHQCPDKELMRRMGQSGPAVALRYEHVMDERDAAIAAGLDQLAEGKPGRRARGGHEARRTGSALVVRSAPELRWRRRDSNPWPLPAK